jgi:hypothetical protein
MFTMRFTMRSAAADAAARADSYAAALDLAAWRYLKTAASVG